MFKRVLVPLDRSPESEEALESAVTIALAADAALDVVVVREDALFTELPYPVPVISRSADEEYLRTIAKRASLTGFTSTTYSVLDGNPADAICAEAKRTGTDLIVMTSHFRTGLARVWAGSVSDRIVRNSGLPVLMVRVAHHPKTDPLRPAGFQRILVALDGSAAASAILPSVRALALCNRAEVLLLRVIQPPTIAMSSLSASGTVAQMGLAMSHEDFAVVERATQHLLSEASDELDTAAAALRADGITNVSWFVEKADAVDESIIAFAKGHSIDLIALTTRGGGASRLVLGSVADAMLRDCTLPVLLQCPSRNLSDQPHVSASAVEGQLPGLVA